MSATAATPRFAVEVMRREHVAAAAELHMAAFAGSMNTRIGRGYVRAFLRWFADRPDAVALFAHRADQPLGYVVGAPDGYARGMNRDLLLPAAVGFATHPWALVRRDMLALIAARTRSMLGRPGAAATTDLPRPLISLVGIGVAPAARGLGVGGRLMDAFADLSRRAGMRAARLSVYEDNAAARRLYERCGWRPVLPARSRTMEYWSEL